MNLENALKEINQIIQRESKNTTYKFALLRGAIEIAQDYPNLCEKRGDRVSMPLGLLVHQWMLYYYPFVERFIPQRFTETESGDSGENLAFRPELTALLSDSMEKRSFVEFHQRLEKNQMEGRELTALLDAAQRIRETIVKNPMRYLGSSLSRGEYQVFQPERPLPRMNEIRLRQRIGKSDLIESLGEFTVPLDYFLVFQKYGSFLSGRDGLILRWAEFSARAGRNTSGANVASILEAMSIVPELERDVADVRNMVLQEESLKRCVWTGERLTTGNLHIDHVLPYSQTYNNDLWNLLPALDKVNSKKSDAVPTSDLIERRAAEIVRVWESYNVQWPNRFRKELQSGLLGFKQPVPDAWQAMAIGRLQERCHYLIEERGLPAWAG